MSAHVLLLVCLLWSYIGGNRLLDDSRSTSFIYITVVMICTSLSIKQFRGNIRLVSNIHELDVDSFKGQEGITTIMNQFVLLRVNETRSL